VEIEQANVIMILGFRTAPPALQELLRSSNAAAILCYDCSHELLALQRVGSYQRELSGVAATVQDARAALAPWADLAQGKRLLQQADGLLRRHSSEDLLYALFFVIHARVLELDVVRHTVNPTWEKGLLRNAREFATMCTKCGPQIQAALTDPETKNTIDLLNACDMRDQVGSYRVIVSYETPQLEDFSLCILQQNNCFGCDAAILDQPRVPLLQQWQGKPLDDLAARQIFIGHFSCREAAPVSRHLAWSWKIVCGANPAYDAFPAQHQLFYPSDKSKSTLWYDPVFKVETLDGRSVWCKRHYRCTPRVVPSEFRAAGGSSSGAWTLTTLDNGVISKEHWTTVDAADDLSWAVFHYSGAAAVVGQSYLGALLCSPDGKWPEAAVNGVGLARIEAAFDRCGIAMWELYGHGPPGAPTRAGSSAVINEEGGGSFMWTEAHCVWEAENPPPLEPIGDQSVQAWRASEKAKAAGIAATAAS